MQLWDFFQGTQERVRNSRGKQAISVRAIEVLLYFTSVEDFICDLESMIQSYQIVEVYRERLDFIMSLLYLFHMPLSQWLSVKIDRKHTVCKLHGPSMFTIKAKIYGVLSNRSSSITFDETSSHWSGPKSS